MEARNGPNVRDPQDGYRYQQCEHATPNHRCEGEAWGREGSVYCVPHTLCREPRARAEYLPPTLRAESEGR